MQDLRPSCNTSHARTPETSGSTVSQQPQAEPSALLGVTNEKTNGSKGSQQVGVAPDTPILPAYVFCQSEY